MLSRSHKISLTAANLKWIAIISMFINHLCYGLYYNMGIDNYFLSDAHWYLTRFAFVIFCFQIAEGMHYTRNRKKYIAALFAFAIISEIPFDLFFYKTPFEFSEQNVFFNLAFGALSIAIIDKLDRKPVYAIIVTLAAMAACVLVRANYLFLGEVIILSFYYLRDNREKQFVISGVLFAVFVVMFFLHRDIGTINIAELMKNKRFFVVNCQELHGLLTWPILMMYNGEKGKNINKWFFYLFYPAHLLLLYVLTVAIVP